jgi:PAS domain S-box-containing protein
MIDTTRTKRAFKDLPISRKLMVITMVTTAAALLLSGIGIVFIDSILFRGYLERDLSALAQIIANNSTAALAFDDPQAAANMLDALKARMHIVTACIYRADGSLLAQHSRQGAAGTCPAPAAFDDSRYTKTQLNLSKPILLQGRRVGTLVIAYDLAEMSERRNLYGTTVVAVLLASSLIAFLLSSRLRAAIATPVSRLAKATTLVSRTKDYSIRVQKDSGDELGVLVDAFNEMLGSIQSRDNEVRSALTAREEALEEAQNARDFLRTTLASIGDAVVSTGRDGKIVFSNRMAESLLGWAEADMRGKHLDEVFQIIHEATRLKVKSPVSKVLLEGVTAELGNDTVLIARDGKEIPIDDTAAPIRDESGRIQGAVLIFRDVAGRRRAKETSRLLASIVESTDDAIVSNDLKGLVTSWNRGAERIFGYTAGEMIGRALSIIAAPDRIDEIPGILDRVKQGEWIDHYETLRRTKSGKIVNVSLTISPIRDAIGRIIGASKIARDITAQVRAADRLARVNADLQQSNLSLARSNEDLERFAFVASHDLQEPLRMITTYAQLLVRSLPTAPSANTSEYVANIVGASKRMRELLKDLLAYTEISAHSDEPVQTVDLNQVVEKVKQNLQASIEETGTMLIAENLPTLSAHEGYFVPLFQNLIGNAIKYRGEQPPRIHVSVQEADGELRFAVSDNGMGIESEYHEKIFIAFKRLHGKKIPGTGIGLAICQRVVERYGGRIWVESEEGHGATFYFTLPDLAVQAAGRN